jgi:hypothetical protein
LISWSNVAVNRAMSLSGGNNHYPWLPIPTRMKHKEIGLPAFGGMGEEGLGDCSCSRPNL